VTGLAKAMSTETFPGSARLATLIGLPLQAPMTCSLQDRFYSWAGLSRKKCDWTVFKIGDESPLGDFKGAAIAGVSNNGGHRRPICVLRPSDFGAFERRHVIEAALTPGANEWHLHFTQDAGKLAADLIAC
jgi:hypothetical protein